MHTRGLPSVGWLFIVISNKCSLYSMQWNHSVLHYSITLKNSGGLVEETLTEVDPNASVPFLDGWRVCFVSWHCVKFCSHQLWNYEAVSGCWRRDQGIFSCCGCGFSRCVHALPLQFYDWLVTYSEGGVSGTWQHTHLCIYPQLLWGWSWRQWHHRWTGHWCHVSNVDDYLPRTVNIMMSNITEYCVCILTHIKPLLYYTTINSFNI